MNDPRTLPRGSSVTSRALAILRAFDASHRQLTLSQIARRTRLPVATAYRLAGELEDCEVLVRCEDGMYRIGGRLWHLGLLSPLHTFVRGTVRFHLARLAETSKVGVQLLVRDRMQALCLDAVAAAGRGPGGELPGVGVSLVGTAGGEVLLAAAPVAICEEILARHGRCEDVRARIVDIRSGKPAWLPAMGTMPAQLAVPVVHSGRLIFALSASIDATGNAAQASGRRNPPGHPRSGLLVRQLFATASLIASLIPEELVQEVLKADEWRHPSAGHFPIFSQEAADK